jgi:uridine phosphorylase
MMTHAQEPNVAPIIAGKQYDAPSVFTAENVLREARRQKNLSHQPVPAVCAFDPDGDVLDYLQATGRARLHPAWACYHTQRYTFEHEGITMGIVGRVVGASFAVLVAEELFVSGCILLISITSAGQITPLGAPPYFVLLDKALRDEGTSYHYLPPSRYSRLHPELCTLVQASWDQTILPLHTGASWTTDAPFRETEAASRHTVRRVLSPSRWKRRRSMPSRRRNSTPLSALLTSPIRWHKPVMILRRGLTKEVRPHSR